MHTVKPLAGQPLPDHHEVAGAVVMGGPMGVDEVDRHPELATEREWLAEALRQDLPVLGICLGAQLLARALGAEVSPGERPELGYAPVEVLDPDDPILGALAPSTTVLHWHGDVFDLPDGATHLARSAQTEVQAFRHGNAWGVLFHPESDFALLEAWMAVSEMVREARSALGDEGARCAATASRSSRARADRAHNAGPEGVRRPGRSKSARSLTPQQPPRPARLKPRGGCSSAGRAPGCGPGGRRFESGHPPLTLSPSPRSHRRLSA